MVPGLLLREMTFQKDKHARPNGFFSGTYTHSGGCSYRNSIEKAIAVWYSQKTDESLQDIIDLFGQRTFNFIYYDSIILAALHEFFQPTLLFI